MRALIGHTGFVGGNLMASGHYDRLFNSRNSAEMRGQSFDEVVCAGVGAVKWQANKDPEGDWSAIAALIDNLDQIEAERFVLISTVDVYQPPIAVNEGDIPSVAGAAYGANRTRLERWAARRFADLVVVRLPALYGPGLKKNAIYDLRFDNLIEQINPDSRFQWYDVGRLETDLAAIVAAGLKLVNIAAEPVLMSVVGDVFFPGKLRSSDPSVPGALYDMQTIHADVLGGQGRYHFSQADVMAGLDRYLSAVA